MKISLRPIINRTYDYYNYISITTTLSFIISIHGKITVIATHCTQTQ